MLSVALSQAEVQPWLSDDLCLAAHNAPRLCVVSGTTAAIAQLQQQLTAKDIACRLLHTSHAFHSPMMADVQPLFIAAFRDVPLHPPQIPFISNLTGTWITASEATDPQYWANHLRYPVRFAEGIVTLLNDSDLLLEVGPGHTLSTFVKQTAQQTTGKVRHPLTSLPHANETTSDTVCLLQAVGHLWLNGLSLNWSAFSAHERRHRVPLPTYPFERQHYWIEPQSHSDSAALSSPRSGNDWFYAPVWHRELAPRDALTLEEALTTEKRCWLVFMDASGLGQSLAERLEQAGQDVVTVAIGPQFAQAGYRAFVVQPEQPQDYRDLLQDLSRRELLPDCVLYLWTMQPIADASFYGLVYLTQALAQQSIASALTVITQQAQDVTGEEPIDIEQAKSLGFSQVISQEYPNLSCRCIDIGLSEAQDVGCLAEQLLAELFLAKAPHAHHLAYRGRYRWQLQYEPIFLNEQTTFAGHYLIVGDFETGLGPIWAEQLTRLDGVKLTLIGSTIPVDLLALYPLSIAADVTDPVQMQQAIEQAYTHHGAICGVFYSTPMSNAQSMALIADLNRDPSEYSFQSKVQGLRVLGDCLQPHSPDFCFVQSSLSSIVGGIGLGAYAAANRAVDALVQHQIGKDRSTRWYSINWDTIQSEAADDSDRSLGFGSRLSTVALTPEQVWSATCHLLTCPAGQMIVSKTDLATRIQQAAQAAPAETHSRPPLTSDYVAPQTEIEQQVAQIWQELLGIDRVGIHDSFFELGGHSLLAIQAIARLRDRFQIELPMRSFLFEAPTVAGIAALIAKQQPAPDELAAIAEILNEVTSLDATMIQPLLHSDLSSESSSD
ncbi:MAG: KR domain-containing protein [Synechococcales cyanobacterium M58_A2018_015]|nr:KR domain-containing protein [Synechococcales cyanobacterium M58_A2018_015]